MDKCFAMFLGSKIELRRLRNRERRIDSAMIKTLNVTLVVFIFNSVILKKLTMSTSEIIDMRTQNAMSNCTLEVG